MINYWIVITQSLACGIVTYQLYSVMSPAGLGPGKDCVGEAEQ
jgi:hypothetical protein